jgi:hypothetical protein
MEPVTTTSKNRFLHLLYSSKNSGGIPIQGNSTRIFRTVCEQKGQLATRFLSFSHVLKFFAVFRIHDILVWIRIRGTMPLTNGSDADKDPAVFVIDLQDANKKAIFKKNFCLLLLKVYLHHFSKIKSPKEITNRRNQGFSFYFCLMIKGSESRSRSIPLCSGFGSGTRKHVDLVDPDPEHWCFAIMPF